MRLLQGVLVALLLTIPRSGLAQASEPEWSRFFLDANLSGATAPVTRGRTFSSTFVRFGEVGTAGASYAKPSLSNPFALVDLGGGVMFSRIGGVGVTYSRLPYRNTVELTTTIPHPTFLYSAATDARRWTEELDRDETAVHIFLAGVVPIAPLRSEVRIAGPSLFFYRADMVQTVLYTQEYNPLTPQNTIAINGVTNGEIRDSALGFNVGGDFTYFFTKNVGLGTGVRFSWARLKRAEEPLSGVRQEIRLGSTLGFVGVRFRFGG